MKGIYLSFWGLNRLLYAEIIFYSLPFSGMSGMPETKGVRDASLKETKGVKDASPCSAKSAKILWPSSAKCYLYEPCEDRLDQEHNKS